MPRNIVSTISGGSGGSGGINYVTSSDGSIITGWTPYAEFQSVTITVATPAVCSVTNNHNYAIGQTVVFSSTGTLPGNITAGTTYYVSAIPSSTTFRISATLGGPDINTTGSPGSGHTVRNIQPTRGTSYSGSSPTFAWTSTSLTPLRFSTSFLATKDAANRAGEGVAYDFTIDRADSTGGIGPAVQQITFDYEVTSTANTYGYGSSTTLSDLTLWIIADPSGTPSLIQPAGYKIDGGRIRATFQPLKTTASYRLIVHVSTTNATAWTIELDNFSVGPQVRSYGPAMSDWQAYSATWGSSGTQPALGNGSISAYWRRVGANLEGRVKLKFGTTTTFGTGTYYVSIPSGLSINTGIPGSDVSNSFLVLGSALYFQSGTTARVGSSVVYDSTKIGARMVGPGASTPQAEPWAQNVPVTNSTSDEVQLEFTVPIVGWSSNTLISDSADTRVVAASYSSASNTGAVSTTTGNVLLYQTRSVDTHSMYNTSTGESTIVIPGVYRIFAQQLYNLSATAGACNVNIQVDGTTVRSGTINASPTISGRGYTAVAQHLQFLNAGQVVRATALDPYGSATHAGSGSSFSYFSLERVSGPSQIAASEIIAAYYTGSLGSALSTSTLFMDFGNKQIDTHNAVVGAGSGLNATYTNTWRYVCPAPGLYRLTATLETASVTVLQQYVAIEVFKNGVAWPGSIRRGPTNPTTTAIRLQPSITTLIQCVAGDVISVATGLNTGALSLSGNTDSHSISIERIGGVM